MKLTDGEILVLTRRRRGHSQPTAAREAGVTRYRYRLWEMDEAPVPYRYRPRWRGPKAYELCFILRRRAGVGLEAAAERLGMTPNWLCEIEHGRQPTAVAAVAKWWSKKRSHR